MKNEDLGPPAAGSRLTPRMKIGDVQVIGGLRVVCVPDYLITHVGLDPNTTGILLPPEAADLLIAAMRKAGLLEEAGK